MSSTHTIGSSIWVLDGPSGQQDWIKASVTKVETDKLTIRTENGDTRVCKPDGCPLQNPPSRGGVEVRQQCRMQCAMSLREAVGLLTLKAARTASNLYSCCWQTPASARQQTAWLSECMLPLLFMGHPSEGLWDTPSAEWGHCGSRGRARHPPELVLERQLLHIHPSLPPPSESPLYSAEFQRCSWGPGSKEACFAL